MPIDKKPSWFKMHDSIAPAVKYLPKDIAGEGFQAAMVYYAEGIEPDLSKLNPAAVSIYAMLKSWIDEAAFDMLKKAETGREAARRRWGNNDAIGTDGYPWVPMDTHTDKNRKEKTREDKTREDITTTKEKSGDGGGGGDDGDLSKLLKEFDERLDADAIRHVYDVVSVGEQITSRYAYARKILTDCANDKEGLVPIFTLEQVKDFLARRSQEKKPKAKKPMSERPAADNDFTDVYADIMSRPRSGE